ncbi:MAG: AAC(3) family N-acetyltransferase [Oscillospiraceae bacterium]|nr:AAC(3) family N-acetyltransferase [Oscillospiraceae bacterium]
MRKFAIIAPLLSLAAGCGGFVLRRLEHIHVFDPITGLPARGALISHYLLALIAFFLLAACLFAAVTTSKKAPDDGFAKAFGTEFLFYPASLVIIGLVWFCGTILYIFGILGKDVLQTMNIYFILLSFLSAAATAFFAIEVYQQSQKKMPYALSIVPTLFFCFWLIWEYSQNAANPVLFVYVYQCLAIISAALCFYNISNFVYNKATPGKAIASFCSAIFFCAIALADDVGLGITLIYIAVIAAAAVHLFMLILNLKPKPEKVTKDDIKNAIEEAGLTGKAVCIHSSLSSFGKVVGGAKTVIDAFLEQGCTLLAPSFTYDYQVEMIEKLEQNAQLDTAEIFLENGTKKIYSPDTDEIASDMGAIPRAMVNTDGQIRGIHPINSFVALGHLAEELVYCQDFEDVYAPFRKLTMLQGYIVLIGVDLTKMTAIHYAEQLSGRKLFIRNALDTNGDRVRVRVGSCSEGFNNFAPKLEEIEKTITVGSSLWRIFPIGEVVKACTDAIREDADITRCDDNRCERCDDIIKGGPIE